MIRKTLCIIMLFLVGSSVFATKKYIYFRNIQANAENNFYLGQELALDNGVFKVSKDLKTIKHIYVNNEGKRKSNQRYYNYSNIYVNDSEDRFYATMSGETSGFFQGYSNFYWNKNSIKDLYSQNKEVDFYIDIKIDPNDFNRFYVKTVDNDILFSNDGGIEFKSIAKFNFSDIADLKIFTMSISSDSSLIITTNSGIYKSNNYGQSWDKVSDATNIIDIVETSKGFFVINSHRELLVSKDFGKSYKKIKLSNSKAHKLFLNSSQQVFVTNYTEDKEGYLATEGLQEVAYSNFWGYHTREVLARSKYNIILDMTFDKNKPEIAYISIASRGFVIYDIYNKNIISSMLLFVNLSGVNSNNQSNIVEEKINYNSVSKFKILNNNQLSIVDPEISHHHE